jgi:hypothetical protein
MKTYNLKPQPVKVGDVTVSAITIGESGRGRVLIHVPCPEVFEYLEAILPTEGPVKKKGRLIPTTANNGWVARISTEGSYIRGANGNVSAPKYLVNQINVVAKAYGAFGDAGRTGNWDDIIISTKLEEFYLRVKPSRGDAYILQFKESQVCKISLEQADLIDLDLSEMIRL